MNILLIMFRYIKLLLLSVGFFSCLFIYAQSSKNKNTGVRVKENFNNNWRFKLDSVQDFSYPGLTDTSWRKLNLPHDLSIEGAFSQNNPATAGGGALPGGMGWYRKRFTIPKSSKNKSVYITFDGVYRNSEVFINGHSLGVRPNGYITFQSDLLNG